MPLLCLLMFPHDLSFGHQTKQGAISAIVLLTALLTDYATNSYILPIFDEILENINRLINHFDMKHLPCAGVIR